MQIYAENLVILKSGALAILLKFRRGGMCDKSEVGLELRFSERHCLHPSNLYSPGGLQICLQFRVPNQSHQATTEPSANPGTVSELWREIPRTPAPVGLPKGRGWEGTVGLSPVLFNSSSQQVQEPSSLKQPPLAWGKGELLARDPPTYPSPKANFSSFQDPTSDRGFSGLGYRGPGKRTDGCRE